MLFDKRILSSKLVKSTGVYTLAKVINACIPFFLLPIMTSYLSPADYGIISMITTVVAFTTPFVSLNLDSAIVRRYYYKDGKISQYIGTCCNIVLVACLIISLLFVLFKSNLSDWVAVPEYVFYFIPIYCFFLFFKNVVLYYWQVKGEPIKYGIFSIAITALEITIALILIMRLGFKWEGRAISLFSSGLIIALFCVVFLKHSKLLSPSLDKSFASHAIKYGAGLIPHAVGASLMVLANRFFITKMISVDETGLYGVATSLSSVLSFVTLSFNNAYVPWLFGKLTNAQDSDKRRIVGVTYLYLIIVALAGIASYFIIKFIFPFFVNSSFSGSMKYIPWLLAGLVFQGGYFMMTNYIMYTEKTYLNGIITVSSGLLSLVLNYFLIKAFGAIGAAIAFSLTYLFYFLFTWVIANRVYKMPWLKFL